MKKFIVAHPVLTLFLALVLACVLFGASRVGRFVGSSASSAFDGGVALTRGIAAGW